MPEELLRRQPARGPCPEEPRNGTLPGSVRSSSSALPPAPRVSPAVSLAVSTALLENSGSGGLYQARKRAFWVRRSPGGVRVFHANRWLSKSSFPPSKVCLPWVLKGGAWDVPGVLPGYPGALGVFKDRHRVNGVGRGGSSSSF